MDRIPKYPDHLPDLTWFYYEWGQNYQWAYRRWESIWIRNRLSEAQNHRCCYCGVVMTDIPNAPELATLEHVIRKADGGTDDWENLAMACNQCNTSRHSIDWRQWSYLRMTG